MEKKDSIIIERLTSKPMEEREIEIVERKGLGHPDFIADSIAEEVSKQLAKEYLDKFGSILHHNVDKVLVVGGQSWREFGKGEVLHPIYILVSGRATDLVISKNEIKEIPIGRLVLEATGNWFKKNFRYLDPQYHIIVDYRIGRGSVDLINLFERERRVPLANDTSVGISYAPLTETEKIVYDVEQYLNSKDFKKIYPQVGEDIKVMGLRIRNEIRLTLAIAFISSLIRNLDEYISLKEEIKEKVLRFSERYTDREIKININTADNYSDPKGRGVYIVVTGTSAEHGDDGMTGRGNRVNGLITPFRPMSMEATAGKNPVSHVGKIYNVLATKIAQRISKEVDNIREVYVELLSQIGKPINKPQVSSISILPESEDASFNTIRYEAKEIALEELSNICGLTSKLITGTVSIF